MQHGRIATGFNTNNNYSYLRGKIVAGVRCGTGRMPRSSLKRRLAKQSFACLSPVEIIAEGVLRPRLNMG